MPAPVLITDLSTTAASNSPAGSEAPSVLDDVQRAHGAFIAQLRDGGAFALPLKVPLGTALLPSYSFAGDLDTGAWSPGANLYAISTGGVERVRVDASGNVGVGTAADGGVRLHIKDANALVRSEGTAGFGSFYALGSAGNSSHYFFGTAGVETGRITTTSAGVMHFSNGSTPVIRATIDAAGNFGVGTTPISTIRSYAVSSGNSTASSEYTSYSYMTSGPTSGSASKYGGAFVGAVGTGTNHTGTVGGVQGAATVQNAGTTTGRLIAASGVISTSAAGTVTDVACAFGASLSNTGGSTFSGPVYSFYAPDHTVSSTGVNAAYFGQYSTAAGKWNLYMSGTADNYLAGNLGIGTAVPTARLEVGRLGGDQVIPNLSTINTILAHAGGGSTASGSAITLAGGNASTTAVFFGDTDDGQMGALIYDHTTNSMQFRTNGGTERMRLDSSGNLGVGTTAGAGNRLEVAGTGSFSGASGVGAIRVNGAGGSFFWIDNPTTTTMRFSSGASPGTGAVTLDNTGNLGLGAALPGASGIAPFLAIGANNAGIGSASANNIAIVTNNTERMRIDSAGNVAIGTTSASTKLTVYGGATGTDTRTTIGNAATSLQLGVDSSSNAVIATNTANSIRFFTNSTQRMTLDSTGLLTLIGAGATPAPNDNSKNVATTEYVKAEINRLGFTRVFKSTDQTVAANTTLNVAHGLGVRPEMFNVVMKCTTAEFGYSIGDEVIPIQTWAGVSNITVAADATNVIVNFTGTSVQVLTKTAPTANTATLANWRFVVRAYA